MRSKDIKKAIDDLSPWYQHYEMEGQFTNKKSIAGEKLWPTIRSMMDGKIKRLKILDLCSNAGYYSVMMAMQRAKVTAVEANPKFVKQAEWTKYFFEQYKDVKIPINFVKSHPASLNYKKMEFQNYVLLSSGFTFIKKKVNKQKLVSDICSITDKVIVATPNTSIENSIAYFNGIFLENEFYLFRRKLEPIPVLLYGRLIKESIF